MKKGSIASSRYLYIGIAEIIKVLCIAETHHNNTCTIHVGMHCEKQTEALIIQTVYEAVT